MGRDGYLGLAAIGAFVAAMASGGYLDRNYGRDIADAGHYVERRIIEPVRDLPSLIANSYPAHSLTGVISDLTDVNTLRNTSINPNANSVLKALGIGALLLGLGGAIRRKTK